MNDCLSLSWGAGVVFLCELLAAREFVFFDTELAAQVFFFLNQTVSTRVESGRRKTAAYRYRSNSDPPAEQVPLSSIGHTASPSGREGTTALLLEKIKNLSLCFCSMHDAPRSCTVFVMTPPFEHPSEGGRDDRGVPYHAESTLSSAQVLKERKKTDNPREG